MSEVVRIHASSGTTGKPTVVGYTKEDIDIWAESVARSMLASGVRPGDMVHVAYGYGLFTGGLGAHYGAEKLGCTVIPMSGGQTAKQVQLIMDFKPRAIMVTPSYMLAMADEFRKQGIDQKTALWKLAYSAQNLVRGYPRGAGKHLQYPCCRYLRPVRSDGAGSGQ